MIDSRTTTTITTTDHMPRKRHVGDDDDQQQHDAKRTPRFLFCGRCAGVGLLGWQSPACFGNVLALRQDERRREYSGRVPLDDLRVVNRFRFLRDDGHAMAVKERDDRHQEADGPDRPPVEQVGVADDLDFLLLLGHRRCRPMQGSGGGHRVLTWLGDRGLATGRFERTRLPKCHSLARGQSCRRVRAAARAFAHKLVTRQGVVKQPRSLRSRIAP